jgi:predicted phosphoribosyltransferase
VILADDAVITGATMRVAARALYRERARRIVIAVPVAVAAAAETLQDECDQLVALHTVVDRDGLSRAYADFSPVTDSEVAHLVRALPTPFA